MSSSKLPAGYHTVTPALVVRDANAAIDFYRRAFGATEVSRMAGPDGKIMHAEIRIGDSLIMLGEENEQWGTRSPLLTMSVFIPTSTQRRDPFSTRAAPAGTPRVPTPRPGPLP